MVNLYVGIVIVLFLFRGSLGMERLKSPKEIYYRTKENETIKIGVNIAFAVLGTLALIADVFIK